MPMKNPPHPGDLIKTEILEALGLTVSKAAEILQVRRATLSDLLHGKAALTPEMALRIEKAFGPDMDHLLRMQLAYDVAKNAGSRAGHLDQAIRPGPKAERRRRAGACDQQVSGLKKALLCRFAPGENYTWSAGFFLSFTGS